jgi:hypothetical protein
VSFAYSPAASSELTPTTYSALRCPEHALTDRLVVGYRPDIILNQVTDVPNVVVIID